VKIELNIREARKLPYPDASGLDLYAVILDPPLSQGRYLVLTEIEMDKYVSEPEPEPEPPKKASNRDFLASLSSELGNEKVEKTAPWDVSTEDWRPKAESETEVPVLEEPVQPDILSNLPPVEDEISRDKALEGIVRSGHNAKGNPYHPDEVQVKQMVHYLVHESSETAKTSANKRRIMKLFCGMTAAVLVKYQDFMPKELRWKIAQYKIQSLDSDPVTSMGADYVPPTWSHFVEGSKQGDEVYSLVNGKFSFHKPRLLKEADEAQDFGDAASKLEPGAADLRESFSSWLGKMTL
tara:strand:+ start:6993 stop:7877 length:885 start_codon:yes stop_codon:yes gene_type:complete